MQRISTEAFRIQGRVILALMLREARTRFGRNQIGYLWALLEPILHILALMAIFSIIGRAVALGDSLPMFLATGLATYFGFARVMRRTEGGYGSNEALLSFPIVKVMDVFVARALLEIATWIVVTILLLGGLILLGFGSPPHSILPMIGSIAALAAIAFGIGTFLGILSQFLPALSSVLKVPTRILYFASGIFYLPDAMMPAVRDILAWNPILHGVTLFRTGYYQGYESHLLDIRYLCMWAVGCLLLALITERIARKPLRSLA